MFLDSDDLVLMVHSMEGTRAVMGTVKQMSPKCPMMGSICCGDDYAPTTSKIAGDNAPGTNEQAINTPSSNCPRCPIVITGSLSDSEFTSIRLGHSFGRGIHSQRGFLNFANAANSICRVACSAISFA